MIVRRGPVPVDLGPCPAVPHGASRHSYGLGGGMATPAPSRDASRPAHRDGPVGERLASRRRHRPATDADRARSSAWQAAHPAEHAEASRRWRARRDAGRGLAAPAYNAGVGMNDNPTTCSGPIPVHPSRSGPAALGAGKGVGGMIR